MVTAYNVPIGPQSFALVADGVTSPLGAPDLGAAPPAISVTASDAIANEAGLGLGTFRFARSGDTSQPLSLHYTVSGTAVPGSDYTALPGVAAIPAGAAEIFVN